jgi:DNA polymerase-3 subunit epsilon
MKLLFVDTETTGLDEKKNRIWQIGGSIRIDGKIVETFEYTHKTLESDLYVHFLKSIESKIDKYNSDDKFFLIAYNARFDENFIREMFLRNNNKFYGSYFYNPSICVMQMAATYFLKRPKIKRPINFKLSTVCDYFKIKVDNEKTHTAKYDAQITRSLYNKLIK